MATTYLDPRPSGQARELRNYQTLVESRDTPLRSVALVANGYYEADKFLSHLSEHIEAERTDITAKGDFRNISERMPTERLQGLKSAYDAAVFAYGHCGSCTSSTVRDAVEAATMGLRVVVCVTEYFFEEATLIARAEGVDGLPIVELPHPMAGRGDAHHARAARAVAARVSSLLGVS